MNSTEHLLDKADFLLSRYRRTKMEPDGSSVNGPQSNFPLLTEIAARPLTEALGLGESEPALANAAHHNEYANVSRDLFAEQLLADIRPHLIAGLQSFLVGRLSTLSSELAEEVLKLSADALSAALRRHRINPPADSEDNDIRTP